MGAYGAFRSFPPAEILVSQGIEPHPGPVQCSPPEFIFPPCHISDMFSCEVPESTAVHNSSRLPQPSGDSPKEELISLEIVNATNVEERLDVLASRKAHGMLIQEASCPPSQNP